MPDCEEQTLEELESNLHTVTINAPTGSQAGGPGAIGGPTGLPGPVTRGPGGLPGGQPSGAMETLRLNASSTAYTIEVEYKNVQLSPSPRLEEMMLKINGALARNPTLKAVVNDILIMKVNVLSSEPRQANLCLRAFCHDKF